MPPRIVELDQGTPEWLAWRRQHIGGSDAPALMYVDRFNRDRYKCWQEKTGRLVNKEPFPGSPMDRGRKLELTARTAYSMANGVFAPPACLESGTEEFMAASLDGYIAGERIIEIKCPSDARTHLSARDGQVERSYWVQMQHSMHVAEVPVCDYVSYYQTDLVVIPVDYSAEYVTQQLLPVERLFWQTVETGIYSFPDPELVVDLAEDEEALQTLRRYLDYRRMREEAEALELDTLAILKCRLWEAGSAGADGVRLHWERRRGPIQYQRIPEIQEWLRTAGNLDAYRGAESLSLHVDRS